VTSSMAPACVCACAVHARACAGWPRGWGESPPTRGWRGRSLNTGYLPKWGLFTRSDPLPPFEGTGYFYFFYHVLPCFTKTMPRSFTKWGHLWPNQHADRGGGRICSHCGKPNDRPSQRYCRACHTAYMRLARRRPVNP